MADVQRSERRQLPVSCLLCQKRKQKCSRDQPCSNCASRGKTCTFVSRSVSASTSRTESIPNDFQALRAENTAIKARLEKLEELVLSGGSQIDDEAGLRPTKVSRIAHSNLAVPTASSTAASYSDPELVKGYKNDVEWLDGVGSRENTRLPDLSTDFDIRIERIEQVQHNISLKQRERCILLPRKSETEQLFNAYVEQVDPMQHVIHIPTVRRNIEQLYSRMEAGERVEPDETVLLVSILASIASYWSPADSGSPLGLFDSIEDASKAGNYWLRTTLDVLEHVKRTASASLGTVQACLLMVFLIYHMEGFSPKVRAILASALFSAKDLALHKTDSPTTMQKMQEYNSRKELVDREMRRRVWWHLACTDWSLGVAGGPHQGSYNVNPKHMSVKRPRNVSDEELESKPEDFEHDISEPTIMAYYLQRILLSELSRDITDLTCDTDTDDLPLHEIAKIDARFRSVLAQLPSFLAVDEDSRRNSVGLETKHRHIILQRYTVNLALHARRCKFHLPLLLRASYDATYNFSRAACLESARAVMKLKIDLTNENGSVWISSSKLGGFLHLFFYALVVLVIDVCVFKGAGEDAASKGEIREAIETLEQAKRHSVAASMFLDSLMATLRKHSVRLQSKQRGDEEGGGMPFNGVEGSGLQPTLQPAGEHDIPIINDEVFNDPDFDALWQSYINSGFDIDPHNWDPLISDLELCVQSMGED